MDQNTQRSLPQRLRPSTAARFLLSIATILLLPLFPFGRAAALQVGTSSPMSPASAPSSVSAVNESLRPALEQVGSALGQVQIDHWKLSHELKGQLHSDVDSIQQDLLSQLPSLFLAAQQSPAALGPQLGVMHNVDALYDVLVRITTTANIAGGKADAATLDNALQRLESARKAAAGQLLQAASMQDQQIARYQANIQAAQRAETSENSHPKTIVVNNNATHRSRHRKPVPHRKTSPTTPAAKTPTGAATPPPTAP